MTAPKKAERRARLIVVSLDSAVLNHPAALAAGLRAVVGHLGDRTGLERDALLALTRFRGRLPTPDDVHAVLGHPDLSVRGGRLRGLALTAEAYAVYGRERRRATGAFRGLPDILRSIRATVRGSGGAAEGEIVFVSSLPPSILAERLREPGLAGTAGAAYALRLREVGTEDARVTARRGDEEPSDGPAVRPLDTERPGLSATALGQICQRHGVSAAEAILVTGRLLPDLAVARRAGMRAVLCSFDRAADASNIEDISMTRDWIQDLARRHAASAAMPPEPYAIIGRPQDLASLPCFTKDDGEPPRTPGPRLVVSNRTRGGR